MDHIITHLMLLITLTFFPLFHSVVEATQQPLNEPLILENVDFNPLLFDLPIVRITTENSMPVLDKDTYLSGEMLIQESLTTIPYSTTTTYSLQIKGRGNSTWSMPKKPYRLKLKNAASLLNLPQHKDWALLANYADKTLLRNALAFSLSEHLQMSWTPKSKAVEVFLNDKYLGVYQLTETIDIAKERLNLVKNKEPKIPPSEIGYLLEIDQREDEDFCFRTVLTNLPFCLKEPGKPTDSQKEYITQYINHIEAMLFDHNFPQKNADFIDIQSFIDFYLVNELAKNVDAKSFSSIYLHKDAHGKLKMGPVWDFDLGFGNANYMGVETPTDFWVKLGPWYTRLFENFDFETQVKNRWIQTKPQVWDHLSTWLDSMANNLQQGQSNNFQRWLILDQYVWPNPIVTGSYDLEMANLKTWIQKRIEWLDEQWQ